MELALDPAFEQYIPKLLEAASRKKIEKCIGKLVEGTINIQLTVWDTPPAGSESLVEEDEEETEEGPLVSSAQAEAPKSLHEWGKDPVVRRTLEIFKGDIIDVKEPS